MGVVAVVSENMDDKAGMVLAAGYGVWRSGSSDSDSVFGKLILPWHCSSLAQWRPSRGRPSPPLSGLPDSWESLCRNGWPAVER